MDDDVNRKAAAAASFGASAEGYIDTDTHSQGVDLERLAEWCAGAELAVDVATGAGHTAGALLNTGIETVVAADAAPAMIATALRQYDGLEGLVADAERLPLATASVDVVTCRIAAHHFPAPEAFVREVARVLKPGGTFALEDNLVPEDDDLAHFFNRLEGLRDPTHVAAYQESTWREWLAAAGFEVTATDHVVKPIAVEPWLERIDALEQTDREEVRAYLRDAPEAAVKTFDLRFEDGNPTAFDSHKGLFRATLTDTKS
ncbi:MAG: class I SAM-dependent methyltransferase [Salinirussus sp.]